MFLLYGAGNIGRRCIKQYQESGISDFVITDSNNRIWGSFIHGLKIIPPSAALEDVTQYEYIMVCTDRYFNWICIELVRKYKIPLSKIISWRTLYNLDSFGSRLFIDYITEGIKEKYNCTILDDGMIQNIFWTRSFFKSGTTVLELEETSFLLLDRLYERYSDDKVIDLVLCTEGRFEYLINKNPLLNRSEWWIQVSATFDESKMLKIWDKKRIEILNFPCCHLVVINKEAALAYSSYSIYVASHVDYNIKSDDLYHPLYIGDICSLKSTDTETTGKNINKLNLYLNEYTAIYWIWKNSDAEIVGMNHYKRYFYNDNRVALGNELNTNRIDEIMREYDLILPHLERLNTTVKENIISVIGASLYDQIAAIISEIMEEKYYTTFLYVHKGNIFYPKAMFVTKREILDQYCRWVFPILFNTIKRIDMSRYEGNKKRAVGYFAETMWSIWLLNTDYKIKELLIDKI